MPRYPIKPLPEEFEWLGVKIPKTELERYIVPQEFRTRDAAGNVKRFYIEYLNVDGRLKILHDVAQRKGLLVFIESELLRADLHDNNIFAVVKVSVKVTTKEGVVVKFAQAHSAGYTADMENGIKKIETAALGRALLRIGIGLEAPGNWQGGDLDANNNQGTRLDAGSRNAAGARSHNTAANAQRKGNVSNRNS